MASSEEIMERLVSRRMFRSLARIILLCSAAGAPFCVASNGHAGDNRSKMLDVFLTCPALPTPDTLQLVSRNPRTTRWTIVTYTDGNPTKIKLFAAPSGQYPVLVKEIDVDKEGKTDEEETITEDIVIHANALKSGVCEGSPSERKKYFDTLRQNEMQLTTGGNE